MKRFGQEPRTSQLHLRSHRLKKVEIPVGRCLLLKPCQGENWSSSKPVQAGSTGTPETVQKFLGLMDLCKSLIMVRPARLELATF